MKKIHIIGLAILLILVAAAFVFNPLASPRPTLGVENIADLRLFTAVNGQGVNVWGQTVWGDAPFRTFVFDAASTATDDGGTVIKPTSIASPDPGRYLLVTRTQLQPDWNQGSSSALDYVKNKPTIGSAPQFYGSGGTKSISKVWSGIVSPSTSNGGSVDISSASFASIDNIQVIASRNTATVTSVPNVSVKSYTTSAVLLNVTEANPATTTILGIPVLSGAPNVFASTSGLTIHVRVEGN